MDQQNLKMTSSLGDILLRKMAKVPNTDEKWTVQEQLSLASAVHSSGDQNWMAVCRSVKEVCGQNRPPDWFTQKSCAVEYQKLLDKAETPKRKKRGMEPNSVVHTPVEAIVQRLKVERIKELEDMVLKSQEDHKRMLEENKVIMKGEHTDEFFAILDRAELAMKEKKRKQKEYEEYILKKREEKKKNDQKVPRGGNASSRMSIAAVTTVNSPVQSKPVSQPSIARHANETPDMKAEESIAPSTPAAPSTPIRVVAPTITNLLTGNSCPLPDQAPPPSPILNLLQNQPLTGPGPIPVTMKAQVHAVTPSERAPTLSMLLEGKTKEIAPPNPEPATTTTSIVEAKAANSSEEIDAEQKEEEQQLLDVFKGLIPENIAELADILTHNNEIIMNPELIEEEVLNNIESESQPQEEQKPKEEHDMPEEKPKSEQDSEVPAAVEESVEKSEKDGNEAGEEVKTEPVKEEETIKTESSTESPIEVKIEEEVKVEPENPIADIDNKDDVQIIDEESQHESKHFTGNEEKSVDSQEEELTDDSNDNISMKTHKDQISIADSASSEQINEEDDDSKSTKESITAIESSTENEIEICSVQTERIDETSSDDKDIIETAEFAIQEEEENEKSPSGSSVIIIEEDEFTNDENDEHIDEKKMTADHDFKDTTKRSAEEESFTIERFEMFEKPPAEEVSASGNQIESGTANELTTTIIIDTDEDSQVEIIKEEEKPQAAKATLPKKKPPEIQEPENVHIDEDNVRTRARASMTPVSDVFPDSPASSDDREFNKWKKKVMSIYHCLETHKDASKFMKVPTDDVAPDYSKIVLQPMDLQTIRQNIENGTIRTSTEFQRDVLQVFQNAIMYYPTNKEDYSSAQKMWKYSRNLMKSLSISVKQENEFHNINPRQTHTTAVRGRKSGRKRFRNAQLP